MFKGCGTALVTPFRADGSLDEPTLRSLVRRQIEAGIDFLVPCGTTGESPTLERREHLKVVEIAVEESKGRVPVVGGAGGNNTAEIIDLARELKAIGVDGLLSVTPYYNKPTQEGVIAHFEAIAASTDLPIILYSVQPRTNVNIEVPTVMRLAKIPNIVAIKEASGNMAQIALIAANKPDDFVLLSGDDSITLPVCSVGGKGVISVLSNLEPSGMTELARLGVQGDFESARKLQKRLMPLMEACFFESNPGPVKYMMAELGLLQANYRLPLVSPRPETQDRLRNVLRSSGLLSGSAVVAG